MSLTGKIVCGSSFAGICSAMRFFLLNHKRSSLSKGEPKCQQLLRSRCRGARKVFDRSSRGQ